MKKFLFFVLSLFFLLSGCISSISQKTASESTPIKVRLKWLHQSQFAGNYVAQEKDFYIQEGLDVELLEGGVEVPSIPDVLAGNSDFGIAGAGDLLLAVSEGKPIKAIAVIYKLSPVVYFAKAESGINRPHDFVGKTVGTNKGTGIYYSYIAMLNQLKINRKLINEVEIGHDLSPFYKDEVQVWTGFRINEPRQAEEAGYKVNLIKPEDWGVNMYADVIITTDDMVNNKPEIVEKFLNATFKGWQYAIENEAEAVGIVLDYAKDHTKSHEAYMLKHSIPLIHTGDSPLGWMDKKKWQLAYNILLDQGIIKNKMDVGRVYSMKFLNNIYNKQ